RRLRPALLALVVLALPPVYGAIRMPQVEAARASAPLLRVGVVQPNVGIFEKHDPANFHPQLRALRAATAALESQGAELVVWPESAYPFPLHRGLEREPSGPTAIHRGGVRGPVIFGALTMRGRCERYNSVVALTADGRVTGVADKVRLLAFGEFIPLWSWLTPLHRYFPCPGLRAGERPGRLRFGGAEVDVLNCFEDVPSDYARTLVSGGPSWLLNVTNDAWFGDTSEPHLHQMVARLRAVETRRDLVRAVNTGVSAHVTATGEDVVHTAVFERASFVANVRVLDGESVFVRVGDLTTPVCWALALGFGVFGWRRRRRRRGEGLSGDGCRGG
ncbi:MAG: apolipoprotein N-acyltransferase, partial [Deltaproteobacteria bacterium]|nr:apolipoprotein N-acyltransferase [Deltaproteobacteria bacterium]